MKRALILWLSVYIYVVIVGFLVQFVLLPFVFPQAHWGEGLMVGGDWIQFHTEAVEMAKNIEKYGWQEWSLYYPVSWQVMSGITAFFYALTGIHKPWIMLFYNAFLWASAVLFLYLTLKELNFSDRSSILAIIPFAIFPSNLTWNAQIHRDGLYILGFMLIFYSIISSRNIKTYRKLILNYFLTIVGVFLIYFARKHMMEVLYYTSIFLSSIAFVFLLITTISLKNKSSIKIELKQFLNSFLVLLVIIVSSHLLKPQPQTQIQPKIAWERSWWLPERIDNKLMLIAEVRYVFLNEYFKDAAGNVDSKNFIPKNAMDFILYIPRAYMLGFLSPFPNVWFTNGGTAGGTIARYITPFETVLIWIGLSLFLLWSIKSRAFLNYQFLSVFIICLIMIYLHVVTEPNLGPIYRKRYVFVLFLASTGYAYILEKLTKRRHGAHSSNF